MFMYCMYVCRTFVNLLATNTEYMIIFTDFSGHGIMLLKNSHCPLLMRRSLQTCDLFSRTNSLWQISRRWPWMSHKRHSWVIQRQMTSPSQEVDRHVCREYPHTAVYVSAEEQRANGALRHRDRAKWPALQRVQTWQEKSIWTHKGTIQTCSVRLFTVLAPFLAELNSNCSNIKKKYGTSSDMFSSEVLIFIDRQKKEKEDDEDDDKASWCKEGRLGRKCVRASKDTHLL